jgi:hypothetical protein
MALEDMNTNEVLVRYIRNMAEIERLDTENLQVSTTKDSIEEPRYVEDLSQWQEYRAAKEEIMRLTDERVATNNEKKKALLKEQQDIRAFLLHSESVPKDKWIRCADDGVYVPSEPAKGKTTIRVAPWEHVMETNGEPERINEIRRMKQSSVWGRVQSTFTNPRQKPMVLVALVILLMLALVDGFRGFAFGSIIIAGFATWWFLRD